MNKIKNTFKKNIVLGSAVVIAIIIGIIMIFTRSSDVIETITITRSTLKQQVSVSGKVVAEASSELGFEQGGRISLIATPVGTSVTRGMLIASIENGDLRAEVLQKKAGITREESRLTSLVNGTRTEQLTIDEQTYRNGRDAFITSLRSASLGVESALLSEIDTMFNNGSSVNPTIRIVTKGYKEEQRINTERFTVTDKLSELKAILLTLTESSEDTTLEQALTKTKEIFTTLNTLIITLTDITSDLYPNNSGYSQSAIDTYKTSVNTAAQTLASTMSAVQSADTTWKQARNSLTLSEAGSTESDINVQRAAVEVARADLLSAEARLQKTLIVAPFNGIITRMDLKQGEIVSPNTSKVSIMSTSSFKIESYIPEVNIAHIKIGDASKITLDAYGTEVTFNATVALIDPAETIRDGVSTYKVTLVFTEQDSRIRSGMTANVTITTLEKPNVFTLPRSVIDTKDGIRTVQKLVDGKYVPITIETGDSTTLGQVEIVRGISEGDVIRVDGKLK